MRDRMGEGAGGGLRFGGVTRESSSENIFQPQRKRGRTGRDKRTGKWRAFLVHNTCSSRMPNCKNKPRRWPAKDQKSLCIAETSLPLPSKHTSTIFPSSPFNLLPLGVARAGVFAGDSRKYGGRRLVGTM